MSSLVRVGRRLARVFPDPSHRAPVPLRVGARVRDVRAVLELFEADVADAGAGRRLGGVALDILGRDQLVDRRVEVQPRNGGQEGRRVEVRRDPLEGRRLTADP